MKKKKILFLANHFITLYSFRKEIINELLQQGHDIYLSLPKSKDNIYFIEKGCHIIETEIDRRGVNPIKDLKLIKFYKNMIPQVNPDIIFSFTMLIFKKNISNDEMEIIKNCVYMTISYILGESYVDSKK